MNSSVVTTQTLSVTLAFLATASALLAEEPPRARALLTPGDVEDSFDFETEQIEGTIRLEGKYHGVTRLVDRRTGTQVIDSRYSALNLFKLMSVNQVMGQPRVMPRTTKAGKDWVETTWGATDGHKAEIKARYEVMQPDAVELTLTVRSHGAYRGYEVFLSNYFDKSFTPHVPLWSRGRRKSELVVPTFSPVFEGTVLVFPRDAHAARLCVDGRWERNEFSTPTVQMAPVRYYSQCMAFMTDLENRLGVVLMSRPRDCYAISSRYHSEKESERLTTYSAFDLSLFGNNFIAKDERTVKVRLTLTDLDEQLSQPSKLYRAFLDETNPKRP